jgi:1-acyl-sn-glycerol-3-phosphate acyltransferase
MTVATAESKGVKRPGDESTFVYEGTRVLARVGIPLIAKLRVEGAENVPATGPAVLAPNHLAGADIPLISYAVPRVTHYMAKIELFERPVVGGYIRLLGAFPVRRGEGDREALRVAERVLSEGKIVVVFPEGHRSDSHALIEAHPGVALIAMRAGAPVVPVAIWGSEQVFHSGYGPWAPTVHVRFGEPMTLGDPGKKRTSEDLKRATDQIMLQIAAMLPEQYRGVYAHGAPADTPPTQPAPTGAEGTPA